MTEQEDIEGVGKMITYYCKKKHGGDGKTRCPECEELFQYAKARRHHCPFGDDKPFCANCVIQCYKPEMREKIRKVMIFAAPRVALLHPSMGFKHMHETLKTRRAEKKRDKLIKAEAEKLGVPFDELKLKKAQERKIQAVKEAKAKQAAKKAEEEAVLQQQNIDTKGEDTKSES